MSQSPEIIYASQMSIPKMTPGMNIKNDGKVFILGLF